MIINSILDSDLYKFTQQQAVLELFPDAVVEYRFKNRGEQKFTKEFLKQLEYEIRLMYNLKLSEEEYDWLKKNCPYLKEGYLLYLKNYRFNPGQVSIGLTKDNDLILDIKGPWKETILFEVPLLALISELYFKYVDTDWVNDQEKQRWKAFKKIRTLSLNECNFADFGTRRRRSFETQETVVKAFCDYTKTTSSISFDNSKFPFVGTSNVYLAMKYGLKAIGSVAHELTQAMQALESLNHCNYYAMYNWIKVYNTDLGIVLCDTITTDMFLQNFNDRFARLFSGVRQDSGDCFKFIDKIVAHYKKLGINPLHKFIIFSDSLNVEKAIKIKKYCEGKINCSFGIGTHFSNDVLDSSPLNMVIKLWSVNNFPVVKISDSYSGKENKVSGDPSAVKIMKWVIKNQLGK